MAQDATIRRATFIEDVSAKFMGTAHLYRCDPPMQYEDYTIDGVEVRTTEYVVASATCVMFSGVETYLFPADETGSVTDWGELEGSLRGVYDPEAAILNAGYEVA